MVNIDLTPQQIEELKKYYESELEQMRKRTDEFQRLLIKLDTKHSFDSTSSAPTDKDDIKSVLTKPSSKKTIIVEPDKAKNPNWRQFILTTLKEKNKSLTSAEIFKSYKKQYGADLTSSKNSIAALSQALVRLRTKDNLITGKQIKGKKGKRYGLIDNTDKSVIVAGNAKAKKPVQIKSVNQKPKTKIVSDSKPTVKRTDYWPKFINETLNKTKRVLSAKELLKHAMVYFNLPKKDYDITRGRLAPALSRLEKSTKSLKTCKKNGQTGRFYGLPEWFDGDNKIKPEFK